MLNIKVHCLFIHSTVNQTAFLVSCLGIRPGSYQDFCLESHRMNPTPLSFSRQLSSAKSRQ